MPNGRKESNNTHDNDMKYRLDQFIDEAIQLELHAAEIYSIFAKAIPEDASFWATLSWEERNHASLLQTGKEILLPIGQFPGGVLPTFIQSLIDTNRWLCSLIDEYTKMPPDRKTAFTIALKIENSAGEQHFQRVMETPSEEKVVRIFQELCEDDIYHAQRIREYMKKVGEIEEIQEGRQKRILLVIDEETVANLLKTILETEGEVDIVRNGRDGLQKILERKYDLIITDVEVPILDGIQLFKQAKEIPDLHKRFLFFTGNPTPERVSFFRTENVTYLTKPSTIYEIREAALKTFAD
jgi:CheY-like chemotaxis protein